VSQEERELKPYSNEIEHEMKKFYQTLSEKDKRRYAAVEARKLGHGGIVYIAGFWDAIGARSVRG
jgi:hypothetical protein